MWRGRPASLAHSFPWCCGAPPRSARKREAVADAIAALDYRPSNAARSLASGRTRTVGVLLDDLANPWFVDLLDGMQSIFREQNLRMVLGDSHAISPGPGESPVSAFMELRVDGLIIAGDVTADEHLTRAPRCTPAVVAGARAFDLPAADIVTNDDVAGARMAVEHLIGLGHNNIAFLTAPTGSADSAGRLLPGHDGPPWPPGTHPGGAHGPERTLRL